MQNHAWQRFLPFLNFTWARSCGNAGGVLRQRSSARDLFSSRSFHGAALPYTGIGDWIRINGMRFHGRHGVLAEETRLGQTFVVDAILQVDTAKAGASDALEDTVSYAAVYEHIRQVVEGPPCKLLEAVAHRAASMVLSEHPAVREIRLAVRKLSIPGVPSIVESVGVEIHRRRE